MPTARQGRYTIRDNFLRSWLDALAVPTAAIHFRPLQTLVEQADHRLKTTEGYGLERLVALDETSQRLRLGSCKRSEQAVVSDLRRFDGHVARFLKAFPRFSDWQVEKVATAPSLTLEARRVIEAAGYLPQSLDELTEGLNA